MMRGGNGAEELPLLTVLVGPPGSGKSSIAQQVVQLNGIFISGDTVRVNQDDQGRVGHMDTFHEAIEQKRNIVVDRMNFSFDQRDRYLKPAKEAGYQTRIIIVHESYQTCLDRMKQRQSHPTIKDEETARKALDFFFAKYDGVADGEADIITRVWPEGEKPPAIISDLDGTLCDCEHRVHHVRKPLGQKKNWGKFFSEMDKDRIIWPIYDILFRYQSPDMNIVFCSGRPDDYRQLTKEWLQKTGIKYSALYMRKAGDNRRDDIVKEIILDFEILTKYKPLFVLDDRDQVVKMWRRRGLTCLQCAPGDF